MVHFCHVYVEIKVMWAALEPCWCDLQGNCAVSTKFMRNLEEIQRTRAGAVQKLFHLINITFLLLPLVYVYHFHQINMCFPLLRDVYVSCSEHLGARAYSFEDKIKPSPLWNWENSSFDKYKSWIQVNCSLKWVLSGEAGSIYVHI